MKKLFLIVILCISSQLFASIKSEVNAERFINKNGVVIDTWLNQIWQDQPDNKYLAPEGDLINVGNDGWNFTYIFTTKNRYCKKLDLFQRNDWRIPKKDELLHIYKNAGSKFKYISEDYYWTDTWDDGIHSLSRKIKVTKFYIVTMKIIDKALDTGRSFIRRRHRIRCVSGKIMNNDLIEKKVEKINKQKMEEKSESIYKKYKNSNNLDDLIYFINNYKDINRNYYQNIKNKVTKLYKKLYNEIKQKNDLNAYLSFVKKYPNAPQIKEAINDIYKIIQEQNNIAGYEWFIKTYPNAPQVKDAISKIHQLAFNEAKKIDTISAYNTFIISYPTAKEVKEANALAKELERYKYTDTLPSWARKIMPNFLADILNKIFGIFSNDEKKSRALLIKAKQIERQGNEYHGIERAGYIIIANRMYDLLQEEYNDTDATLRFLESEEFKDFIRTFKDAMRSINDKLDHISRYSSEILQVSKQGLNEASADRAMSEYKTQEYRKWQKFMHFRDKGYN